MTILHRLPSLSLLVAALLPLSALAQVELMLNPTRVVLAKNQRAAQVELINNSARPATYRISAVNRRMSETGQFITVTEPAPDERFADSMLTWSPRQVTLQPGSAQVVRLLVRKSEGLAAGEYRSHLQFEKLPTAGEPGSAGASDKAASNIGVVIKTLVGASIPVIVRHGETDAAVALTQLVLHKADKADPGTIPMLAFRVERSGNSSVYGDLDVSFRPRGGQRYVLGRAAGVAVYTPNALRRALLPLQLPGGATLTGGELRLTYRERPDSGGKLLAEAVLALP